MRKLEDILSIKTNDIKPEKGKILISEPFLGDYYFKRAVVLLADHNEEGSFGVIMNKPLTVKLNKLITDFPHFEGEIFLGGPVESESLFFIHTLGDLIEGSMEISKDLYWGGKMEVVKEMILLKKIKPENIRFYIGYSGWLPDQLDKELKRNSWVVSRAKSEFLLNTKPELLWKMCLEKLGGDYLLWPSFPNNPISN